MTTPTLPPQVFYLPVCRSAQSEYVTETFLDPRTFADVVDDVWNGQIEDLSRLWCVDITAGTSSDETKRLAEALADISFAKCERPYPALRKFIENQFVDFYDSDGEAYDVAMRREHGTLNRAQQL